jgi:hypothetical protein
MPKRIQRKRTKGWRAPEGAVYVGRGSEWGNIYTVAEYGRKGAVTRYRQHLLNVYGPSVWVCEELRGKDLMCWCALTEPCHADVLLEFANQ